IVAKTDILNGLFYNMDKAFGYQLIPEDNWDDFWDDPDTYLPIVGNNY
ncbi:putative reductive dehalogenase (rdhA), partial [marine sediment metagenome]